MLMRVCRVVLNVAVFGTVVIGFYVLLASPVSAQTSHLPACPDRPEEAVQPCRAEYKFPNGVFYSGDIQNGKPSGHGVATLPGGDKYIGNFDHGLITGKGLYIFSSGQRDSGTFRSGKLEGPGNRTWPTGEKYTGGFQSGQPNGRGTLIWPDGKKYVGDFLNGRPNGEGTEIWPDGQKYVGEFKNSWRDGKGTNTRADGAIYIGEFKSDKCNGEGTLKYYNGDIYTGEFKNDKIYGRGTLRFVNGEKYVGEFKDGKFDGYGMLYAGDGAVKMAGVWADNKFIAAAEDKDAVSMEKDGTLYVVPVELNAVVSLKAIVDSGASEVSIPSDVFLTLLRTGTLSNEDLLEDKIFKLADGSEKSSKRFRIRHLKVGNKIIENVDASVAPVSADLLLGQSFLSRFKSWSINNEKHVLLLH